MFQQRILSFIVDRTEFLHFRKQLNKTQVQVAQLLGTSIKAVHSYEQGWRNVPAHVERQLLFLLYRKTWGDKAQKQCWVIKKCPPKRKKQCPAWEFQTGKLCWFINGTICEGEPQKDWREKMRICRSCEVLTPLL